MKHFVWGLSDFLFVSQELGSEAHHQFRLSINLSPPAIKLPGSSYTSLSIVILLIVFRFHEKLGTFLDPDCLSPLTQSVLIPPFPKQLERE